MSDQFPARDTFEMLRQKKTQKNIYPDQVLIVFYRNDGREILTVSPSPLRFHPAPAFSPSPRPVLLSRRRAHGDRQGAIRQVRAGAVAAHAVHLGKEVAAHLLAGTAPAPTLSLSQPPKAPVSIFFLIYYPPPPPFRCLFATVPSTAISVSRLATSRPARPSTASTCLSCPTTIPYCCHFWVRLVNL